MRHSTRFTFVAAFAALGIAPEATAVSTAAEANAALSFWMTWGLVYLGIGVVLMVFAVAAAVHERRAWSSLLEWTETATREDGGAPTDANAEGRRAA